MNKVYTNEIFNVNLQFYPGLLDYLWKGCIMEGERACVLSPYYIA